MSSQQLLSLKVLRLSKPTLSQKSDLNCVGGIDTILTIGQTDLLQLPPAFGNIYLGETFTSYLCINNDSSSAVQDVSFKAELQTATQRFTLADTIKATTLSSTESPGERAIQIEQTDLLPRQSSEFILHHEIKELGIHILVCSIHYTPPKSISNDGSRMFFRKFFKFQVLNPFGVKSKATSLDGGQIALEVMIQNLATIPFCLNSIQLDQNNAFSVRDLNTVTDSTSNIFGGKVIRSLDIRQYLYILEPRDTSDMAVRTLSDLGTVKLDWTSTMGQNGHLQTTQLTQSIPSVSPFEMKFLNVPVIKVEVPFTIKFQIRNNMVGERLRLSVQGTREKMIDIMLCGSNEYEIGPLDSSGVSTFDLDFIAFSTGLHELAGLVVHEKISGTFTEIDMLGLIEVII